MANEIKIIQTMTGDIFQPVRLYYQMHRKSGVLAAFNKLHCMTWVRGHWTDALNSRGFSTGYKRRIPGVCLCGGGGGDRVRDREDLLRR